MGVANSGNGVLVDSAGWFPANFQPSCCPVGEYDTGAFMKVIEVNLYGFFLCVKHAARVMKAQRSGAIIQINSKSGKKGSYKN